MTIGNQTDSARTFKKNILLLFLPKSRVQLPPCIPSSDGPAALPLPRVSHFFKSKIHYSCNYGTWPSWSISFLFSYIVAAIATGTYRGRTDKCTMLRFDLTSSSEKWVTFKVEYPFNYTYYIFFQSESKVFCVMPD